MVAVHTLIIQAVKNFLIKKMTLFWNQTDEASDVWSKALYP